MATLVVKECLLWLKLADMRETDKNIGSWTSPYLRWSYSAKQSRASLSSSRPNRSRQRLLNTSCPSRPRCCYHPSASRSPSTCSSPRAPVCVVLRPCKVCKVILFSFCSSAGFSESSGTHNFNKRAGSYSSRSKNGASGSVQCYASPPSAPSHLASRWQCVCQGHPHCAISHTPCHLADSDPASGHAAV